MDVMLASFGLAQNIYWQSKGKKISPNFSFFYDAPPFLSITGKPVIDVTPFILYDKVIINKTWLDQKSGLQEKIFSASILKSDAANELVRKGIVEPRDYVADTNKQLKLLEKMTEHDLSNISAWSETMKKSSSRWQEYAHRMSKMLDKVEERNIKNMLVHSGVIDIATHGSFAPSLPTKRRDPPPDLLAQDAYHQAIQSYLLGVNNTLLLSREYAVSLFDWFDYEPFYSAKVMWAAMQTSSISMVSQAGTILSYYLPLEQITSFAELLHIRDKAKGLREYLDARQQEDKGADQVALSRILHEIDQAQRKVVRYQKISSYFTIPLSLIPIPLVGSFLEKVTGDIVDWGIEKKLLEKYQWHFSLLNNTSTYQSHPVVAQTFDLDDFSQCKAITKAGKRCKNKVDSGSEYCHTHAKGYP